MPEFGRLTKIQMLAAIRDYPWEALADALEQRGLDGATADVIVVERGRQYDARLLLMTAYERVVGEPLAAGELPADLTGLMTRLELKTVSRREQLAAEAAKAERRRVPGAPRAAAASTGARVARASRAKPERPAPPVCPTCFMQLRAGSQVCENCG